MNLRDVFDGICTIIIPNSLLNAYNDHESMHENAGESKHDCVWARFISDKLCRVQRK